MRITNVFLILATFLYSTSCSKKETTTTTGGSQSGKIIANAGADMAIALPVTSVTLDASATTNTTGTSVNYMWQLLSGPAATISSSQTTVTALTLSTTGNYLIELKVWNNLAESRDTIKITLNPIGWTDCSITRNTIDAVLLPVSSVPEHFDWETPEIYAAGNKLIIPKNWEFEKLAGGNPISVYDINTKYWVQTKLSIPRWSIGIGTAGNKVFFAGGSLQPAGFLAVSNMVEIYDLATNSFTIARLSQARKACKVVSLGKKVLFAGGYTQDNLPSKVVDIFDLETGIWSVSQLAGPARAIEAAVTIQDQIYLCGGATGLTTKQLYHLSGGVSGSYEVPASVTNHIDVYNVTTGTWSLQSMSIPKINYAAVAANDKLYLAGGIDMSNGYPNFINNPADNSSVVEVKQLNTATTFSCLAAPKRFNNNNAVFANDKIVFFTGWNDQSAKVDVYNTQTNSWSILKLPSSYWFIQSSIVTIGNEIFIVTISNGNTGIFKLML